MRENYLEWAINPNPGESILISGNHYAQSFLEEIDSYCRRKNANTHLNIFSDEEVLSLLKSSLCSNESTKILNRIWIPGLKGKNCFILRNEEYIFDKIILLFSHFTLLNLEKLQEWKEILVSIKNQNMQNLRAYSKERIKTILLEYPLDLEMEKYYREALAVDYQYMAWVNQKLVKVLENIKQINLKCPLGTDLTLKKGDRPIFNEDCSFSSDHIFQLPGGEVFFAPLEAQTNGEVYCQGESLGVDKPVKLFIRDGVIDDIVGDMNYWKLKQIKKILGIKREMVGEFGIGTNDRIKIKSSCSLYEKKRSTVHVGVGDNTYYGGYHASDQHIDLVVEEPTVYADDLPIIIKGNFQIEF